MNELLLWYGIATIVTVSGLVAFVAARALQRRGPHGRDALTMAAMLALTLLPLAALIPLPRTLWHIRWPLPNVALMDPATVIEREGGSLSPTGSDAPSPFTASPGAAVAAEVSTNTDARATMPPAMTAAKSLPWLRGVLGVLVLGWLAGVSTMAAQLWLGWRRTRLWLRTATVVGRPEISVLSARAAKALGLYPPPPVLSTRAIASPLLVRAWRPVVLLPEKLAAALTPKALEEILLHEFSHAQRRDLWIGLWQRVVAALYWFQPMVRRLNGAIDVAREEACDARVLQFAAATHYAHTLLLIAESMGDCRGATVGVGAAGPSLEQRIGRLLHGAVVSIPESKGNYFGAMALLLLAAGPLFIRPMSGRADDGTPIPKSAGQNLVDAAKAQQLEQGMQAAFACRRTEQELWITPAGDVHTEIAIVAEPGKSPRLEKRPPPAGSLKTHVLPGVEVWAQARATVDVVPATGNSRSFLPAAIVRQAGAAIVGEIDLAKEDPLALGLAGLTNVLRTRQTTFKIARLLGFNLGLGPEGGTLEVLVLDQEKPRVGIMGRDWIEKLRRGDFGLIFAATGQVYYGRFLDDPGQAPRIQLASQERRPWKVPFNDCMLHAVGVYWSKNGSAFGDTVVEVGQTDKPLVLSLSSYYSVTWHVRLAPGANLRTVIVSGYFEPRIEGLPATTPVLLKSYFPRLPQRSAEYFYAYDRQSSDYETLKVELRKLTGLDIESFQGKVDGVAFRVGK